MKWLDKLLGRKTEEKTDIPVTNDVPQFQKLPNLPTVHRENDPRIYNGYFLGHELAELRRQGRARYFNGQWFVLEEGQTEWPTDQEMAARAAEHPEMQTDDAPYDLPAPKGELLSEEYPVVFAIDEEALREKASAYLTNPNQELTKPENVVEIEWNQEDPAGSVKLADEMLEGGVIHVSQPSVGPKSTQELVEEMLEQVRQRKAADVVTESGHLLPGHFPYEHLVRLERMDIARFHDDKWWVLQAGKEWPEDKQVTYPDVVVVDGETYKKERDILEEGRILSQNAELPEVKAYRETPMQVADSWFITPYNQKYEVNAITGGVRNRSTKREVKEVNRRVKLSMDGKTQTFKVESLLDSIADKVELKKFPPKENTLESLVENGDFQAVTVSSVTDVDIKFEEKTVPAEVVFEIDISGLSERQKAELERNKGLPDPKEVEPEVMTDVFGDNPNNPTCKHCGRRIQVNDDYGRHTEGGHRGKGRCDPDDLGGRPYGYNAETSDMECSAICRGSRI